MRPAVDPATVNVSRRVEADERAAIPQRSTGPLLVKPRIVLEASVVLIQVLAARALGRDRDAEGVNSLADLERDRLGGNVRNVLADN